MGQHALVYERLPERRATQVLFWRVFGLTSLRSGWASAASQNHAQAGPVSLSPITRIRRSFSCVAARKGNVFAAKAVQWKHKATAVP